MRFIRPIEVTPAKLTSSNVPETDNPPWSAVPTYALGNKVMLDHRNYEALAAVPAGVKPGAEVVTEASPAKWLDLGATNRWKMFDEIVGTLSTHPGSVSVTIQPGAVVNSLALVNVQGESVSIVMTDPIEGVVATRAYSLIDGAVDNWYDWFFEEIELRTSLVVLDLPAYGTASLTVTVTSSGTAGIGALVIGKTAEIGEALYGTGVGIDDYSTKERDRFGGWSVTEGEFSDTAKFPVAVDTDKVSKIKRLLTEVRAKPVVWVGEETYEATILYGFFTSFGLVYSGPVVSDCQLEIEGLT
ncbi:hypothetical protein [Pseudomonas fluorescens]|uniref:Carbohydrate-binding protein n=1 Tax=Pseudomonas fluorescens TaxID=294 RepID=A0A5E7ETX6_PSEFL|nr:hypothetical protein [Pseudomonas fluorescens]VVO30350.1 hypothetical protein PS723_04938 [Pseudomonas fluorescens]